MINIANLSINERGLLFRETSFKSNISEVIIEKDFWVCFILEHLFNYSRYNDKVFFKGGTSLSKCYNIIKRFSEDVDLILDPSLVGFKDKDLWLERSNTAQQKFNNKINNETNAFLLYEFIPNIKKELNQRGFENFKLEIDSNDPLSVLFIYDNVHNNNYIKPEVKLEMGTLAAKIPREIKIVEPYIQKYLKEISNLEFNVYTIKSIRTFFEKLTILHDMANKNNNYNLRYSRHYYDTYMLINAGLVDEANDKLDLLEEVVKFKNKFYYSKRSNMDDILIGKLRLIPNDEAIEVFKKDYMEMKEMFFGETPPFPEILRNLKKSEEYINSKIIKVEKI